MLHCLIPYITHVYGVPKNITLKYTLMGVCGPSIMDHLLVGVVSIFRRVIWKCECTFAPATSALVITPKLNVTSTLTLTLILILILTLPPNQKHNNSPHYITLCCPRYQGRSNCRCSQCRITRNGRLQFGEGLVCLYLFPFENTIYNTKSKTKISYMKQ